MSPTPTPSVQWTLLGQALRVVLVHGSFGTKDLIALIVRSRIQLPFLRSLFDGRELDPFSLAHMPLTSRQVHPARAHLRHTPRFGYGRAPNEHLNPALHTYT